MFFASRIFTALIVLISISEIAMASPPPPDVAKTVGFIILANEAGQPQLDNGSPRANGTCFFVIVENPAGEGGHGYLVTAKHVLKDDKGEYFKHVYVRLNDLQNGSQLLRIDLRASGADKNVYVHPDPTVDIAVIPGVPDAAQIDFLMLPTALIKSKEDLKKTTLRPGSDVFFTGLFAPHLGDKRNAPIFRFGRVAMFTDDRVRWQEQGKSPELVELYLLETMSFGGNSGSPVFFSQGMDRVPGQITIGGDEITLAGVMRGNFNEPRAGGFIQAPNAVLPVFGQNIGIAAVTPGYLLREILYSDELKTLRAQNPIKPPDTSK